jgi:hypothetical protein
MGLFQRISENRYYIVIFLITKEKLKIKQIFGNNKLKVQIILYKKGLIVIPDIDEEANEIENGKV